LMSYIIIIIIIIIMRRRTCNQDVTVLSA